MKNLIFNKNIFIRAITICCILFFYKIVYTQNVNLNNYELSNTVKYSSTSDNLSGITFNEKTNTLFIIQNKPTNIYEVDLEGKLKRTVELKGFEDTEGIVYLGETRFAVTEEGRGRVIFINISSTTKTINYNADYAQIPYELGNWSKGMNDGLEGLSYNKSTKEIIVVREYKNRENKTKGYFTFNLPTKFPAILKTNEVKTGCGFAESLKQLRDFAGIHYTGSSTLVLSEGEEADHKKMLIEIDANCNEISKLSLRNINQPEGVTLTDNGVLYIVSEPNFLYKYTKQTACTDPCAPNYNPNAQIDDGSCLAYNTSCNQNCTVGSFGGTWDADSCACINQIVAISGCTNPNACNYKPNATCDDDSCDFGNTACSNPCTSSNPDDGCNITIDSFDSATCTVRNIANCPSNTYFNSEKCTCDAEGCMDACAPNYNPNAQIDDGSCLAYNTSCNQNCNVGSFGGTWDAASCACINQIVPISGCTNPNACNYKFNATCDDDSCYFGNTACSNPCTSSNPDDGCNITIDSFDSATCTVRNIANCPSNTYFNSEKCTCDSLGCMDSCAPNYNPNAQLDDGSCLAYNTSCNQNCTVGSFGGTWDADSCECINQIAAISGCTNTNACNYKPNATCDDDSCNFGYTTCSNPCNLPNLDDGCSLTTDFFDEENCKVTHIPDCASNENFNPNNCTCESILPNCRYTDSVALVKIYKLLYIGSASLWDLTKPMDTWQGITLNANGCVDKLKLSDKGLNGIISANIDDLREITYIELSKNSISGTVPPEIGNLSKLKFLNLGTNKLKGPLPFSIGNLTNLEIAHFSSMQLTQLPSSFSNLTKLKQLNLRDNYFKKIPAVIRNLSNLENLYLNSNKIDGQLPAWLSELNKLNILQIQNNQFSDCYGEVLLPLCNQLTAYYSTNRFISDGNKFDTSWENFCQTNNVNCSPVVPLCHKTDSLALVNIYESLNGKNLDVNYQWNFTKSMDTWFGVTLNANRCVDKLEINKKNLSGQLPPAIGNLSEITVIELSENEITGNIPAQIGNLTKLKKLSIALNKMGGNVPSTIGKLTNLENLQLHDNQFTAIPTTIRNLTNLKILYLRGNKLTDLPVEMGNLSSLELLNIAENQLTHLPASTGNLTSLKTLYLNNNQLTNLPSTFGKLSKLSYLFVQHNQLTNIPKSIGDLSNLLFLHLYNNLIVTLPASIQNLENLSSLRVNDNLIVGQLPAWLTEMDKLNDLKIQNNQLNGCYADNLTELCKQLPSFKSKNEFISHGNTFDLSWEEFCIGSICNGSKLSTILVETYNHPNPFNSETNITFELFKEGKVRLFITDMTGKTISTLLDDELQTSGVYSTSFNAENLPTGIYYYTITVGDYTKTRKMVLMK